MEQKEAMMILNTMEVMEIATKRQKWSHFHHNKPAKLFI